MVNELALMCDVLGVDVYEVIDAAATRPFGYIPFYPSPGLGGHCIPIDSSLSSLEEGAEFQANAPSRRILISRSSITGEKK
jgi:UDP-N-acetyl-D-mannosaminuronate dehydrogenase